MCSSSSGKQTEEVLSIGKCWQTRARGKMSWNVEKGQFDQKVPTMGRPGDGGAPPHVNATICADSWLWIPPPVTLGQAMHVCQQERWQWENQRRETPGYVLSCSCLSLWVMCIIPHRFGVLQRGAWMSIIGMNFSQPNNTLHQCACTARRQVDDSLTRFWSNKGPSG